MVEGGADFASEEEVLEAIWTGHKAVQPVIDMQEELIREAGKAKREFEAPASDPAVAERVRAVGQARLEEALVIPEKMARYAALGKVKKEILAALAEEFEGQRKRGRRGRLGPQGRAHAEHDHHPEEAHRRPGTDRGSAHLLRGRGPAPGPRLGSLHPGRDPGPGDHHPGHPGR